MKILFIGNSYTYYNDSPKIFEALAIENGKDVIVHSVTKGGRKLFENLDHDDENHKRIRALLESNQYDVLFLQEHSNLPITSFDDFLRGVIGLCDLIKATRVILYTPWGYKDGSPKLDPLALTNEEMTRDIYNAYGKAAKKVGASLSPVGLAFANMRKISPKTELYNPDMTHPSLLGSAIAALCHYKTLFSTIPKKRSTLPLGEVDAAVIKALELIQQ
ncbi:MAG: hypothetical protein IKV16_05620 [Clostridia bacterium]|nr:hypothetical protein [Clostridia bacterium]